MVEIIQGLWIGRSLSAMERLSITTFLRHGHEYHLYCYDDVGNVPAGAIIKDGNAVLPASEIFCYQHGAGRGSVASFSDLFRYKLLMDKGGWWVDTDVVCLQPFGFPEPVIFASEHTRSKAKVATAVIKLPPGHPIAARCYETAREADRSTLEWGQIGPDLLTRVVVDDGIRHPLLKPAVFCPIPWWEWRAVVADDARAALSRVSEESHSIHLWHEMWRRAGIAHAATFPPTSLFAQLLQQFGVEA